MAKYENISLAIHVFGRSFLRLINDINGVYVIDELFYIRKKGYDIEIDWLNETFTPESEVTASIKQSMGSCRADLERHLTSQDVDIDHVCELKLVWPARGVGYIWAIDDRGREYQIHLY